MNKKSLVVQSNSLVEAKYRLSVEEQKIIKILIAQIKKTDKDFQDYEFSIKNLAELLGMEHTNTYGVLRSITKKLMSRVLEFYDPKTNILLQSSWLSSAQYKHGEGTIILRFDPALKPLLLQLQSYFTKYELGHVLRFRGQYTIRFFEFRKSFLGKNKKTVDFPLNELRDVFGLQKDEYQDFDNFRRRVLEPARLELLEAMGESFMWEAVRRGRGGKVTSVKITFDSEREMDGEIDPLPALSQTTATATPEIKTVPSSVRATLLECGVSPALTDEFVGAYEEAYLLEKIAILNAHKEPLKNRAGFLIKAIQEDWKDAQEEERRKNEERRQEAKAEQSRKRRFSLIREAFNQYQKNHTFQQYEEVPETSRAAWRNEFLATLAPIFKKRYASRPDFGIEDAYFRAFVMQHKLVPLTLDDYLAQEGLSLEPEDRRALDAL